MCVQLLQQQLAIPRVNNDACDQWQLNARTTGNKELSVYELYATNFWLTWLHIPHTPHIP